MEALWHPWDTFTWGFSTVVWIHVELEGDILAARPPKKLRDQLERWRADLINLTKRNNLLHFKHTKTSSLEIIVPDPDTILSRLDGPDNTRFWEFSSVAPPEHIDVEEIRDTIRKIAIEKCPVTQLLTNKLLNDELIPALKSLDRRVRERFVDTGLWTMYLALGFLKWIDPEDSERSAINSPLLLVPVELTPFGPDKRFRLTRREDDAAINPVLTEKLIQDFGITLPNIDSFEDPTVEDILQSVRLLIGRQAGWVVENRSVIAPFSFQKESIYRDLGDNAEDILGHPMIQLLGLGPDSEVDKYTFVPLDDAVIDSTISPEEMFTIRDADSTQRRCIIAAREGKSFVMDGPPGTGKSQTISNIIAELIGTGKTVLFVSEKAAALDVVYKRLKEAGLHEFVLELHSHKTSRKAVAEELGRALVTRPRATIRSDVDVRKLKTSRLKLTKYSSAINEIRQPLNLSAHDAIGIVSGLRDFPSLNTAAIAVIEDLDQDTYNAILEVTQELEAVWAPVADPSRFHWSDLAVKDDSQVRINESTNKVRRAQDKLAVVNSIRLALEDELLFENPTFDDLEQFLAVLRLLDKRPDIPPASITMVQRVDVMRLRELKDISDERNRNIESIAIEVGLAWDSLNSDEIRQLESEIDTIVSLAPLALAADSATASAFISTADVFELLQSLVISINDSSKSIFAELGITAAQITLHDVKSVNRLLAAVSEQALVMEQWLNLASLDRLETAFGELSTLINSVNSNFTQINTGFAENVVEIDASALKKRFTEVHKGLRKFSSAARKDKKLLKKHSATGKYHKNLLAHLDVVVTLREQLRQLESLTTEHGPLVGEHLKGRQTDFRIFRIAIDVTHNILDPDCRRFITTGMRDLLIRRIGLTGPLAILASQLTSQLDEFKGLLIRIQEPSDDRFLRRNISDLVKLLIEESQVAKEFANNLSRASLLANRDLTWSEAFRLASLHYRITEANAHLHRDDDLLEPLFGSLYQAEGSNWEQIVDAGQWLRDLADLISVSELSHADALWETSWTSTLLADALINWDVNKIEFLKEFVASRAELLDADLSGMINDATDILDTFLVSVQQITTWCDFQAALSGLERNGLVDILPSLLDIKDPNALVPAMRKSLLEGWIDIVLHTDKRLMPLSAVDKDTLVEQFTKLDKDLVDSTSAKIINFCSSRRPTSGIGAAGLIQRQGQLKRKHKPTRDLFSETMEVALQLKPCFMMSPMSVSQYLPHDMTFDAIIFDEASQVKPADAINAIYRGKQLIIAGDQKQLPPTSFFDHTIADGDGASDEEQLDEFESILDLCNGTGGIESLSLLWHYRSQHEDLITFSNYRFYAGKLKTFPSAQIAADDLGIALFYVEDGRYRRGSQRDNPIEAETVVDRVIFHRRNHPHLSMGVVAFSSAQQDAIMAALEHRARTIPDLADINSDDRLDGFFVKNLENVQGDDRDIIIFSIGYGPDETGRITMNFGPLSQQNGNRRLNVAITRAKRRIEIVTSIRPGQFTSGITGGSKNLHDYLEFAERGSEVLFQGSLESEGDADSPFEVDVANAIREMGYEVVPQVGAAGYRIDIGVLHPDPTRGFLLGVEADGATYHRTFVARDRDRLRQAVLEGLGWKIHRIWSTAWFRDRKNEELRLQEILESSLSKLPIQRNPRVLTKSIDVVVDEVAVDGRPSWAQDFVPGTLGTKTFRHDFTETQAVTEIVGFLKVLIDIEAPIHEDRLLKLIREFYGIHRSGNLVREAFETAVRKVIRDGYTKTPKGFISGLETKNRVRVPKEGDTDTIRAIEHISSKEIELALTNLVRDAGRVSSDELTRRFSRLYGWSRTGFDIQKTVAHGIATLIRANVLRRNGDGIQISS